MIPSCVKKKLPNKYKKIRIEQAYIICVIDGNNMIALVSSVNRYHYNRN